MLKIGDDLYLIRCEEMKQNETLIGHFHVYISFKIFIILIL